MENGKTGKLKKEFIRLIRSKNAMLGSVMSVQCEMEIDVGNGVLVFLSHREYTRLFTENADLIDGVAEKVFGRKMTTMLDVHGKKGRMLLKGQTAGPEIPGDSPAGSEPDPYEYMLDAMYFRNQGERTETAERLRNFVTRSMGKENSRRSKTKGKEVASVRELKIYQIPAIIRESLDIASLKESLKKRLGKGRGVPMSLFAVFCGPFPWNWSFDVGEFAINHGRVRFIGRPAARDEKGKTTGLSVVKKGPATAGGKTNQPLPGTGTAAIVRTLHPRRQPGEQKTGMATAAKSAAEIALETEVAKLKERIDYFERLFEDHIHDVRTGQPYKPVKLGLVKG